MTFLALISVIHFRLRRWQVLQVQSQVQKRALRLVRITFRLIICVSAREYRNYYLELHKNGIV